MHEWFTRCLVAGFILLPALATAHFQTLIPSHDLVHEATPRIIRLDMAFTHPMQRARHGNG